MARRYRATGRSGRHFPISVHAIEPGLPTWRRRSSSCCGNGRRTTTRAVKYGDRTWTWREHLAEAAAEAAALIAAADPDRPLHVGVLLGNTPDMLSAMAAAGLGGYVLCGINTTRRGDGLLATSAGPTARSW